MPSGYVQIPTATVSAQTRGDIGSGAQPYTTDQAQIPYLAPYLGRRRMLQRISLAFVCRWAPTGSTASPPEVLEATFQLLLGTVVFSEPVRLDPVLTMVSGLTFYVGEVNTDFNNPIPVAHADNGAWRFVGALAKQEGKAGRPTLFFTVGELELP